MSYSIREAVILDCVLRGMDFEARCKTRAVKVAADVVQAPNDLPSGAYEVSFEGRKVKVHKTARGWTMKSKSITTMR